MSLIAMAVFDTVENGRTELTDKTLGTLAKTVDFSKHRLFIIDNNSCDQTKSIIRMFSVKYPNVKVITNAENKGTARAINQAWKLRAKGENCVKMDNDIVIHQRGWMDQMDEAIYREPLIGIVGLKRKDCWEWPGHPERELRTKLHMLPHQPGQRWIVVEQSKHIMGTCQMYSSALLDKIGYLYQPSLYGYDDVIASHRSHIAGFINVFLPHVDLDHIDPGGTEYTQWKCDDAGLNGRKVSDLVDEYIAGTKSIYHGPED